MVENNSGQKEISIESFPFVEVNPKEKAPFCVDGRQGKVNDEVYGPYPQLLGGSLMPVVLEWLMNQPEKNLTDLIPEVFQKLTNFGYPLGVHTSTHAHEDKSDCGFADNLGRIIDTFVVKFDEIKKILSENNVYLNNQQWGKLVHILKRTRTDQISPGSQLIESAKNNGAILQTLDGEHQEQAAIVNLVPQTTLNVDQAQERPAFNLDFWLVQELADKFNWDKDLTTGLSLGLYVSTKMVLADSKREKPLEILVRK